MRVATLLVVLVLAPLAAPAAGADAESGASYGVNGGYVSAGVWDLFWLVKTTPASNVTLDLTWAPSLFPGADYDLRIYRDGALDDNTLQDREVLAESMRRHYGVRAERIAITLPPGEYVVAVMPFQTQGERYTLTTDSGDLAPAARAPGTCWGCA